MSATRMDLRAREGFRERGVRKAFQVLVEPTASLVMTACVASAAKAAALAAEDHRAFVVFRVRMAQTAEGAPVAFPAQLDRRVSPARVERVAR
jgi:hypothetical protein